MMRNYSQLAMIGILLCGVVLSADALYFDSVNMYFSNALVFTALMACSGYLLKLAHESNKTVDSSLEKTSAFHVQLGTEIAEQLSSAHTELGNTQAILSDAIGKLVSNFILISDGVRDLSEHTNDFSKQIHEVVDKTGNSLSVAEHTLSKLAADDRAAALQSIEHVRAIMNDLAAFNEAVAKNAIDLNFISTNVEQNVLVVISTLQFQDMSSQLIEHARLRMTALQEVANEMGKGTGTGRPTRSEYLAQIAAYNRLLDKHVVSLDKQKASPVRQKDFGTGDIELF
jgi:methyl-accepting chemotaxis protein